MAIKPTSNGYHFSLASPGRTQSGEFHDEPKNADYQSHWIEQIFSALDEGFCLQMIMNHIQKQVTNLFKDADLSKLTPEQKMSIQDCVDKMNLARGKGMQA